MPITRISLFFLIASVLFSATPVVGCASATAAIQSDDEIRAADRGRGRHNSINVDVPSQTISFSYGSPELHTLGFDEFERLVRDMLSGQTVVTNRRGQGIQIEYFSPEGQTALWYAGNQNSVRGQYEIRQSSEPYNAWGDVAGVIICFRYYSQPVPGDVLGALGDERCTSGYAMIAGIEGKRAGDVFDLRSGGVPYVLDPLRSVTQPPEWADGASVLESPVPHYLPAWVTQ
jgi:hypothetical protein